MAQNRPQWSGTLMMVGQPAEEAVGGASPMLKDGLFTRFPRPDYAFAVHDDSGLAAGTVGFVPGFALSNTDSVDITIFGHGGHGAMPQTTVDPVAIAARTVLALQTIVSRENDPNDPVVLTVGSIHGGTRYNVIPDEVKLQLSGRTYKDAVHKRVLAAIERITKAEAESAGAPKPPLVVAAPDSAHATYNDPQLTERIAKALQQRLGEKNVSQIPPKMVSEDFSEYSRARVPSTIFFVGAVNPGTYHQAKAAGAELPSLHSSGFAPDLKPTLETAIATETTALLTLMPKK